MFGREYYKQPEILLSSFHQMNKKYKKIKGKKSLLQQMYLFLFGIPEIGFQLRCMYFETIITRNLKTKNIKKILDAGSGIGVYSFWLARKYSSSQVVGGEIDTQKIEFARGFAKTRDISNIEFKKFDITKKISKKGDYNLIVNIDVLEHIHDYKKVLKNFSMLLSNKGYLYIHTPQLHQKRIFKSFAKWGHEDHVHEGYTPQELKEELKKNKFKIIEARETFGFFGKLAWELNHLSFSKGFIAAGLLFPIVYLISIPDLWFKNKNGLGTAIIAQKIS